MADLAQLESALQNAHAAGDTAAAQVLAGEISRMRSAPAERGVVDKLFGTTGPRYQTWPERLIRETVTVPQRTMEAAASAPPGTREFSENVAPVALEAAMIAGPVNPAIRAGDQLIPGVAKSLVQKKTAVPTTQELAKLGGADIRAATQSDLRIAPEAVADYAASLQQQLMTGGPQMRGGIHPSRARDTNEVLRDIQNVPREAGANTYFSPADLQAVRENLSGVAQNFNPNAAKDQLAASRVIKGLDEFLPSVNAKDVMVGAPSAAPATREQLVARALAGKREAERVSDLFGRGRGNYAAAQRSNDLTGALDRHTSGVLERAEGRAQAANSGRNIDNTIRQKVAAILEKEKEVSGLSNAEISALERVRDGGKGRNVARQMSNWLGGGGGLGQTTIASLAGAGGYAAAGIPGALVAGSIPYGVGTGARAIANALAKRDMRKADELMRKRSPEYQRRMANPEMAVASPEKRAALIRALMLQEQQQ